MGRIDLKINQLLLSHDNPRITSVESQRDALQKILQDQETKLVELAKDIVEYGLSPIDRILVVKSKDKKNSYVVHEGNRRVAALKILNNPQVLKDVEVGKAIKSRLEKLAESFNKRSVEPIDCFEADSAIQASHWMEIRHNGQSGGKGTVPWTPLVASRFRGETAAVQALEFLKEHGDLDKSDLDIIERKFSITTLDRLLGAVSVRDRLGVDVKNGDFYLVVDEKEALKPLKRIVLDIAHKKITVSDVKHVSQMIEYLDGFKKSEKAKTTKKVAPKQKKKTAKKVKKKSTTTRPRKRAAVIPESVDYEISDARTDLIFQELKGLDVNNYVNACSVLMRLFLEFSLLHFMRQHKIKVKFDSGKEAGKNKSLNTMLAEVIDKIVSEDLSLKPDFKFLTTSVNQKKSPIYVGLLHQFVHNRYFAPTSDDLRTTWDNSQPLFDAIWSEDD